MTAVLTDVFRGRYHRAERVTLLRHRHFENGGVFGRKTYALLRAHTQNGVRFVICFGAGDALHPVMGFQQGSKFIPLEHRAWYESETRARHTFDKLIQQLNYPPERWLRGALEACGRIVTQAHDEPCGNPGIGERFAQASHQARQAIAEDVSLSQHQKQKSLAELAAMKQDLYLVLVDVLQRHPESYLAVLTARNPWRKGEPPQTYEVLLPGPRREAWMRATDHLSGGAFVQSLRRWTDVSAELDLILGHEESQLAEADAYAYLDGHDSPELRQQYPFSECPKDGLLSRHFLAHFHYRLWESLDAAVRRIADFCNPQPKFPNGTPVVLHDLLGLPLYRGVVEGARIGPHGKETLVRLNWTQDGRDLGQVKAFRLMDQMMLAIDNEPPRRTVQPPE